MLSTTHIPAGVAAGLFQQVLSNQVSYGTLFVACSFGALGAMLPDLDSKTSKISRIVPPISLIVRLITKISHRHNHGYHVRGGTHEPWFWILITLIPMILAEVFPFFVVALGFGVISHLILDACNPAGIAFLAPFSKKRFSLIKIPTGSYGEKIVRLGVSFLCFFLLVLVAKKL